MESFVYMLNFYFISLYDQITDGYLILVRQRVNKVFLLLLSKPRSNSGLVRCIHFHNDIHGKDMRSFFFLLQVNSNVD